MKLKDFKFRMWDSERKCYLGNGGVAYMDMNYLNPLNPKPKYFYVGGSASFKICKGNWKVKMNNEETNMDISQVDIEPCLGVKDKNGTLIFENDIIRLDELGEKKLIVCLDIINGAYCFDFKNQQKHIIKDFSKCEVMGNIREINELMKDN